MQLREFFFVPLTTNSSDDSPMNLQDETSSPSSTDGSKSLKIFGKRINIEDSPVSCPPRKKPRPMETKDLLSAMASSSSSTNSRVFEDAFNGSLNYSIDHPFPCVARNLMIDESVNISTDLSLFTDPWPIKKLLTESDLGNLSRLIISKELVDRHILIFTPIEFRDQIESIGVSVSVWDHDTNSMHQLKFKRWVSSRSYVLNGDWRKEFVKRRMLNKGDEIGLFWDRDKLRFNFTVLQRAS